MRIITVLERLVLLPLAVIVLILAPPHLAFQLTPPADRPEHRYLFSLFTQGARESNQMHRFRGLSRDHFYVGGHGVMGDKGVVDYVEDTRAGTKQWYTPASLARLVTEEKGRRGLPRDIPIMLLSCNTGTGEQSFALRMSELMEEDVYAVEGWLGLDDFGFARTGMTKIAAFVNYGHFKVRRFRQGEEISY